VFARNIGYKLVHTENTIKQLSIEVVTGVEYSNPVTPLGTPFTALLKFLKSHPLPQTSNNRTMGLLLNTHENPFLSYVYLALPVRVFALPFNVAIHYIFFHTGKI